MKSNKHVIVLSDRQEEMLKELCEKIGETNAGIFRMALHYFHAKERPVTAQTRDKANAIQSKRLEILAKTGTLPTLKAMKAEDKGKILCDRMNGTIVVENRKPDRSGGYCLYASYQCHRGDTRIQSMRNPLEYLTAD